MAEEKSNGKTIVLAVDESDMSLHAFHWTLENMLKPDDHLLLIHVQPYHEVTDVIASAEMAVPIYAAGRVREDSLQIAKDYAKRCQEAGVKDFKEDIILEDGSSGAAICSYIESLEKAGHHSDLTLILGSRELGFFKRAFIGSTSEYCVRHCHCPVIVVKMQQKQ